MKKRLLSVLSLIAIVSIGGFAQTPDNEVHPTTPLNEEVKIILGENQQTNPNEVMEVLVKNAPIAPEYRNLPEFAVVGRDKKFYLTVGANIKATASFDWGNPISGSCFTVSDISPAAAGSGGKFQFTAVRSQLSVNFVGLPNTDNQLGIYLSMNFSNSGESANLQNAYVKYRGFTVGNKLTMYLDQAAGPYTIDSEGPNSIPGIWNTCFNYEHLFGNNFKIGAGFELPLYSVTAGTARYADGKTGTTASVSQRCPDFPLYVQYGFNGKGHIRLSGIFRDLQYRDINMNENKNDLGCGAKLSGFYNAGHLVFYWSGQYGKGIASYLQDNTGMGLDMIPSNVDPGHLKDTKSWGAMGALQYNYNPKCFSTICYSHVRNYMDRYAGGNISYDDQYQWGQYALANFIYSFTSHIQTGIEYIYGRKMEFGGQQNHDNRLQAMLFVSF